MLSRVRDFSPYLTQILAFLARETEIVCEPNLREIFLEHPRLVLAVNHATPLSWLPAMALLCVEANRNEGEDRRPIGVMDRFLYQVPGLKFLAEMIGQSPKPHSFEALLERMNSGASTDLVVFPEGSNCFFGEPDELQSFRSPRFVEIAILLGSPILLVVHRGSESWAKSIPVDESMLNPVPFLPDLVKAFLTERLFKTGKLALPMWPHAMGKFVMRCELFMPEIMRDELEADPEKRRQQIVSISDRIHRRMGEMLESLDQTLQSEAVETSSSI